jgi:hypothetical protein
MIALLAIVALLLLAAGAFVGANFCAPGGGAQQALLGLGGALVGMILPSIPALLQGLIKNATPTPASEDTAKRLGLPSPGTPVICTLVLASLLLAGTAAAQARGPQALGCLDAASTYCVVPAAAVGWQVKTFAGQLAFGGTPSYVAASP